MNMAVYNACFPSYLQPTTTDFWLFNKYAARFIMKVPREALRVAHLSTWQAAWGSVGTQPVAFRVAGFELLDPMARASSRNTQPLALASQPPLQQVLWRLPTIHRASEVCWQLGHARAQGETYKRVSDVA
jgi:hypothetical protein